MRQLDWSPLARDDLAEIDAYWWLHNPQRADAVLERIDTAARFLIHAPNAGISIEDSAGRKCVVRGTSYIIIYRLIETGVEVLRIYHSSQNWQGDE